MSDPSYPVPPEPRRGDIAPGRVVAHAPESMSLAARVIAAACVVRHAPSCGPRGARALLELAQAVDAFERSLAPPRCPSCGAEVFPDHCRYCLADLLERDPSPVDPSRLARDA